MKLIGSAFAIGVVAAACTVAACTSTRSSTGSGENGNGTNSNIGNTGQGPQGLYGNVGASLDLAPGVSLQTLHWTISNGTNSYPGVVNIGDAQSVEWVAGGILAGSGYTVSVNDHDSNGDNCSGSSAPFNVAAGQLTQVTLQIVCTVPTDSAVAADVNMGVVEVDAGVTINTQGALTCPGITSLTVNPAEVMLGQAAQLGVMFTDNPIVTWTVAGVSPASAGGSFSDPHSATPTFQCDTGNSQVRITVTVQLQADAGGQANAQALCAGKLFTTISALVNCEGSGIVCTPPTIVCGPDGGQTCVNPTNNPNNCGSCGNVCPATAPVCQNSVCVSQPPTACTTAPCAASRPNSVRCTGNANGVCTATEAIFATKDIAAGRLTGGQLTAASACYSCLVTNQCVNSTALPAGTECQDVAATAQNGTAGCLAVVNCTIGNPPSNGVPGHNCATSNPDTACFCAPAATAAACNVVGAANGQCLQSEADGLGFPVSMPASIQNAWLDVTRQAGMANAIFSCAFSSFQTGTNPGCGNCLN